MRFAIALSVLAVAHYINTLRYELTRPLRVPDSWVDFSSSTLLQPCPTEVSQDWLKTHLYLRCYGRHFEGRLERMIEPSGSHRNNDNKDSRK